MEWECLKIGDFEDGDIEERDALINEEFEMVPKWEEKDMPVAVNPIIR